MSPLLDAPMGKNDAGAKTVRQYFLKLLLTLVQDGEGFSGKRPFGNSGWEYELAIAWIKSGHLLGSLDEDGYVLSVDRIKLAKLMQSAVRELS